MNKPALILLFSLQGCWFCPLLKAEETNSMGFSADRFQEGLQSLKASAEKLSVGNAALADRINQEQARLISLQEKFQLLTNKNNDLTRSSLKLQDLNPARAKRLAELEKEMFELDERFDRQAGQIKLDQETLAGSQKQIDELDKRLTELGGSINQKVFEQVSPSKEKMLLLKNINESKLKQSQILDQITHVKPDGLTPQVNVYSPRDKEILLRQIAQTQQEIEQLIGMSRQPFEPDKSWTPEQIDGLEKEVKSLEANARELEVLVDRLQQKPLVKQSSANNINQDQQRLRRTLVDLKRENQSLNADLYQLRQQMVQLDKRKTNLEASFRK